MASIASPLAVVLLVQKPTANGEAILAIRVLDESRFLEVPDRPVDRRPRDADPVDQVALLRGPVGERIDEVDALRDDLYQVAR